MLKIRFRFKIIAENVRRWSMQYFTQKCLISWSSFQKNKYRRVKWDTFSKQSSKLMSTTKQIISMILYDWKNVSMCRRVIWKTKTKDFLWSTIIHRISSLILSSTVDELFIFLAWNSSLFSLLALFFSQIRFF